VATLFHGNTSTLNRNVEPGLAHAVRIAARLFEQVEGNNSQFRDGWALGLQESIRKPQQDLRRLDKQ
jgi:hypothetical protein